MQLLQESGVIGYLIQKGAEQIQTSDFETQIHTSEKMLSD